MGWENRTAQPSGSLIDGSRFGKAMILPKAGHLNKIRTSCEEETSEVEEVLRGGFSHGIYTS